MLNLDDKIALATHVQSGGNVVVMGDGDGGNNNNYITFLNSFLNREVSYPLTYASAGNGPWKKVIGSDTIFKNGPDDLQRVNSVYG